MICTACQHTNLPGGVRCIYCGTPFPATLDFDLGTNASNASTQTVALPASAGNRATGRKAGFAGSLLLLAAKAKSLLVLLKLGKIAVTLGSMLVFIGVDAKLFGWKFGVGIAICILVHEMGHVIVNWRKGLKQTAPMFIPFVGAVIFIKGFPDDPTIQSESGAGGPVAGMLAALVCLLIGNLTGNLYWLALANIGFLLNLFNLIPFPPLDGSHISTVFSPKVWDTVLIVMLLWVIKVPTGMLWMILIVSFLFRLGAGNTGRYQLAAPAVRIRMAAIYLILCLGLASGAQYTLHARSALQGVLGAPAQASAPRSTPVTGEARSTFAAQPDTDSDAQPDIAPISPSARRQIAWILRAGTLLAASLFWLGTAYLLTIAAGRSFAARDMALVAVTVGLLVALLTGLHFVRALAPDGLTLLGAYFAASVAALIYAGYQAAHRMGRAVPLPSTLRARCMAWAAGAALLVAYATNSLAVVALVALFGLAWYACHPWMLVNLAASLTEQAGNVERELKLRRRTIALCPDRATIAVLWHQIARTNLNLGRGSAALEALQARDNLIAMLYQPGGVPATPSIADLVSRVEALTLLGRFPEALECCERILQAPQEDPLGAGRLWLTHVCLADVARYRDWPDETLAQVDWSLRAMRSQKGKQAAILYTLRATALVAQGQIEEARAACDQALAANRDTSIEAWIATLRAQAHLQKEEPASAERETVRAMRLLPGSLGVRYWRGKALLAGGQKREGETLLYTLAQEFPNDYWGRRARTDLGMSVAASTPA
jgi:Zn-dependent protease/tetratricopeptide (TPR) repeat protein